MDNAIKWYKSLNVHMRINVKTCFVLLTGVEFESLAFLFSYGERIEILYNKLKIEGFDIN
jgi:hypothetical protein